MSQKFITELWLRDNFSLGHGTELNLPRESKLTPSAHQLLQERRIKVKFVDDEGRVYLPAKDDGNVSSEQPVHPLTGGTKRPDNECSLCGQHIENKPDTMTHLDKDTLVPKNNSRLKLRGKLDTIISYTVLLQNEFDPDDKYPVLNRYLADIRSYLGNILKAEVTGEELPPVSIGDMDEEVIHAISHNPLKYLGHDHIVPCKEHGVRVARLNYLRALVREAEVIAADLFIDELFRVSRQDLMKGLNRSSSAIYVLMMMTLMAEKGKVAEKPEAR